VSTDGRRLSLFDPPPVEAVPSGREPPFPLEGVKGEGSSPAGRVLEVYADGGCLGKNPSPLGGTWAWVHVGRGGAVLARGSGVIRAGVGFYGATVSNNVSEFVALLLAIESLPGGWSGPAFTDSNGTLLRFQRPGFWQAGGGRMACP
jgi:hypothetical protein